MVRVYTMHTGTSTQNVYFLLVERSESVSSHIIRVSIMWRWYMVCIYFSLHHVFKQVGSPTQQVLLHR